MNDFVNDTVIKNTILTTRVKMAQNSFAKNENRKASAKIFKNI